MLHALNNAVQNTIFDVNTINKIAFESLKPREYFESNHKYEQYIWGLRR